MEDNDFSTGTPPSPWVHLAMEDNDYSTGTPPSPFPSAVMQVAAVEKKKKKTKRPQYSRGRLSVSRNSPISPSFYSGGATEDDEEAIRWAAAKLDEVPEAERIHRAVLVTHLEGEGTKKEAVQEEVDVRELTITQRQTVIDNLIKDREIDNAVLLKRIRARLDRVGIEVPSIEVRFQNLSVDATCHVGDTTLPTLWNATKEKLEDVLNLFGISISSKVKIGILKDISGVVKPSKMTLLLGPPGSGKTTLLKALAQHLDSDLQVTGKVTYNGHMLDEFLPRKTAAYVSQYDMHLGEITVRETLDFSARYQGVGHKLEQLSELSNRENKAHIPLDAYIDIFMKATAAPGLKNSLQTDYILKLLALDICADTIVGNNLVRGISGGQKKRVTTGEMLVGPAKALFMDEISTGLDSSTTYQIVKFIGQLAQYMDFTVLMSLLQPAPETYDLFDDILLLGEGHIVYHGPRQNVLQFFKSCGFKPPKRKGTADFLQEVLSQKDQQQYWYQKGEPYQYVTAKEFSERFADFHVGQGMRCLLATKFDKSRSPKGAIAYKDTQSKIEILKTCYDREILLMKRNAFIFIFKTTQIMFMAIVAITVFIRTRMHRRSEQDGDHFVGALSLGVLVNMFNGYSEVAFTLFRIPVFFKQRKLRFYPAWAYALPTLITRLPISIFEASVWVILTYYSIGYAPAPSRFFKQLLVIFALNQMASSLFRFVAGVSRTMVVAGLLCPIMTFFMFTLGGFVTPKAALPKWWAWGYWVSPLTHAQNAMVINEFLAPEWNKPLANGQTLGIKVLDNHGIPTQPFWFWASTGILLAISVTLDALYVIAVTNIRAPGRVRAVVTKKALKDMQTNPSIRTYDNILSSIDVASLPDLVSVSDEDSRDMQRTGQQTPMRRMDDVILEISSKKKGLALPFTPMTMSFCDIMYSVDMPQEMQAGSSSDKLQLLKGITGAFRPGVLTALMGESGAGKTTLMDVLAGRKTIGYIEGEISISGFPKKQETFARISGYCEQNDIHSPQVTVYESLLFSAWLRLSPDILPANRQAFINEVMELVELESIKDTIVGIPGLSGLSTEQRKRLTIAVELVANPSIIFMDEPTSGLDARSAAIVMRTIRNAVNTGRTIVCTIHQPSIDIFEAFDELLLLKKGGQVLYAGPLGKQSADMIEYFEAIPGVPKIKDGYNPATWMLEITSSTVETNLKTDFAALYEMSDLCRRNDALVQELSKPLPKAKDLAFDTQYTQTFFGQFKCCLWKQHLTYWRTPEYNCNRMLFTIIISMIFGTIFWGIGSKQSTEGEIISVMGAMYGAVIFLGITNCNSVQPVVAMERTVFYRERGAGMYSSTPYAMTHVLIELPYVFVQTLLYAIMVYSMISLAWTAAKFMWFFFVIFFSVLIFTYYGMMAVATTPNIELAAVLASFFYGLFNLFSGFYIPRTRIPGWWIWYYWICPTAWSVYGIIGSQYGDVEDALTLNDGSSTTVKAYVEDNLGFKYDFLGVVAAGLVGFAVLFGAIYVLTVKRLNFQNR